MRGAGDPGSSRRSPHLQRRTSRGRAHRAALPPRPLHVCPAGAEPSPQARKREPPPSRTPDFAEGERGAARRRRRRWDSSCARPSSHADARTQHAQRARTQRTHTHADARRGSAVPYLGKGHRPALGAPSRCSGSGVGGGQGCRLATRGGAVGARAPLVENGAPWEISSLGGAGQAGSATGKASNREPGLSLAVRPSHGLWDSTARTGLLRGWGPGAARPVEAPEGACAFEVPASRPVFLHDAGKDPSGPRGVTAPARQLALGPSMAFQGHGLERCGFFLPRPGRGSAHRAPPRGGPHAKPRPAARAQARHRPPRRSACPT